MKSEYEDSVSTIGNDPQASNASIKDLDAEEFVKAVFQSGSDVKRSVRGGSLSKENGTQISTIVGELDPASSNAERNSNVSPLMNHNSRGKENENTSGGGGGGGSKSMVSAISRKGFYSRSPVAGNVGQVSPLSADNSQQTTEKKGFYSVPKMKPQTSIEETLLIPENDNAPTNESPQKGKENLDEEPSDSLESPKVLQGNSPHPSTVPTTPEPSFHGKTPMLSPMSLLRSSMTKREGSAAFSVSKISTKLWGTKSQVAELAVKEAMKSQVSESQDRFNLLLLQDGEYYFRDYFCNLCPNPKAPDSSALQTFTGKVIETSGESSHSLKVLGRIKICSNSFFFVPQDQKETVFRVDFSSVEAMERCSRPSNMEENDGEMEEFFSVKASQKMDVFSDSKNVPHVTCRVGGEFLFVFKLLHASLAPVLQKLQKLLEISRFPKEEQMTKLKGMIKKHEEELYFNAGWFERPHESVQLEFIGSRLVPLVSQPGRIVLTEWNVYFQSFHVVTSSPVEKFRLDSLTQVKKRRVLSEDVGIELIFSTWSSVSLVFKSEEDCDSFYQALLKQPGLSLEETKPMSQWQAEWIEGKISNFDYLMYLNREANRSFNDLSQYPVFPWIIADYKSEKLDLDDPLTYRDLSKPIGALNEERLEGFKEQFREMAEAYEEYCEDLLPDLPPPHTPGSPSPPYLYGCHYSTPAYVAYFKLRTDPQLMLKLQNGRYDMPDRLLSSIPQMWESTLTKSSDLKELIPEFYGLNPSLLVNSESLELGTKQNGDKVWDVELPPWADSPMDFMVKLRSALESPLVSKRLHKWINLIFGCKQSGCGAIEAENVFHPLTYDSFSAKALSAVEDETTKEAIKVQMREFGRTPKQLFTWLHPRKQNLEPVSQPNGKISFIHKSWNSALKSMKGSVVDDRSGGSTPKKPWTHQIDAMTEGPTKSAEPAEDFRF